MTYKSDTGVSTINLGQLNSCQSDGDPTKRREYSPRIKNMASLFFTEVLGSLYCPCSFFHASTYLAVFGFDSFHFGAVSLLAIIHRASPTIRSVRARLT